MSYGSAGATAFNATVRTGEPYALAQAAREQRAKDLAEAIVAIRNKISTLPEGDDRKADLQAALAAAKAEADLARAEAQEGSE